MRLSEGLRALFGGRKYVKESEISRAHLMRYLCGKGEITEVRLVHVSIQPFGGDSFPIVLDEQQNSVSHLKRAIQEQQGTPIFSQQLFLLGKSADDARGEPLGEEENITSCSIAMCVLTNGKLLFTAADHYPLTLVFLLVFTEGGEWDPSSLAISVSLVYSPQSIIWLLTSYRFHVFRTKYSSLAKAISPLKLAGVRPGRIICAQRL